MRGPDGGELGHHVDRDVRECGGGLEDSEESRHTQSTSRRSMDRAAGRDTMDHGGKHPEEREETSSMHTEGPWRQRQRIHKSPCQQLGPLPQSKRNGVNGAQSTRDREVVNDVCARETHDASYPRLRQEMWTASPSEGTQGVRALTRRDCTRFAPSWRQGGAHYVTRAGQFIRIWGHMLEDVGYTCEVRQSEEEGADLALKEGMRKRELIMSRH